MKLRLVWLETGPVEERTASASNLNDLAAGEQEEEEHCPVLSLKRRVKRKD